MSQADITIQDHGSIFLVDLNSEPAKVWWNERVVEGAHFGRRLVVEHRYIGQILEGALEAGLGVSNADWH